MLIHVTKKAKAIKVYSFYTDLNSVLLKHNQNAFEICPKAYPQRTHTPFTELSRWHLKRLG